MRFDGEIPESDMVYRTGFWEEGVSEGNIQALSDKSDISLIESETVELR